MQLSLQKFTPEDIPRLISWIPDADFLLQWAGPAYHFPLDEDQLLETWKHSQTRPPEHLLFKAVDTETGEVVGHVELLRLNQPKGQATLGRVLIGPPDLRGQGLGQELVGAALEEAFEKYDLEQVELGVFPFNRRAVRLYEHVGFKVYLEREITTAPHPKYARLLRMRLLRNEWHGQGSQQGMSRMPGQNENWRES